MRKETRKSNLLRSQAGTSMVEVIVAFFIVVLMMTLFTRTSSLASRIVNRSLNHIQEEEAFEEAYYKQKETATEEPVENGSTQSPFSLKSDNLTIPLPSAGLKKYSDTNGTRYFFDTKTTEP